MKNRRPIFYWDACIFIAWLNNEERRDGEMEGLAAVADLIGRGEAVLIVSQHLRVELLPSRLPDLSMDVLDHFFMRKNTRMLAVESAVIALAQRIRDWDNKIDSSDAIHLATAIRFGADEFHTFDSGKKRGARSLLSLDGDVAGFPLRIRKPATAQFWLPGIDGGSIEPKK